MTKAALIEAMKDFPDDMPVRVRTAEDDEAVESVEEVCPTPGIGCANNYLLLS